MSIPNHQAAEALHEIDRAGRRSATAYSYSKASPHLILWGVIWIIGYSQTYVRPQWWPVWPVLTTAGIAADVIIGTRTAAEGSRPCGWRIGASFLAIALFIWAVFVIVPPRGPQVGAFIPLFVALAYAIWGIWMRGTRIILLALGLGALTVGAYFGAPHYFLLWMAAAGGGALILGGIWLREA